MNKLADTQGALDAPRWRGTALVGAVLCVLASALAVAQTPIPPTIRSGEDQNKRDKIVLDKDSRLVADEYADLLRQLQDVVKDYSGYLQDEHADQVKRYRESLLKLKKQLAEGMGVDRSLLNKVLRGRRHWPKGWLDRATTWLSSHAATSHQSSSSFSTKGQEEDQRVGRQEVTQ